MKKKSNALFEPRKFLISILLGLMCFGGSFFPLSFSLPPFSISISWFDFLPLLAGMAFGGRYGFMASTLGFGALYPFVLWPSNGWACLVTSLLLISWTTANGYLRGLRQRKPAFWNLSHLVYPISVLVYNAGVLALFPLAMRFNPPFWYPRAELSMSPQFLYSVVIKGVIVFYILALFVDYILKLPVLRKLFGLEMKKESRFNGRVALVISIGTVLLWYVFILFNRILLAGNRMQSFFELEDPREVTSLLTFLSAGIVFGSVLVSYQESRQKALDSLTDNQGRLQASEEKYRGIFENVQDVFYETSLDSRILEVSPSIEILSGGQYRRADVLGRSMYEFYADAHNRDDIIATLQERGSVNDFEVKLKNRDESLLYCSISAKLIRGGDGRPIKILGSMHDIAERTRAEAKIRQALAEKETLLHELYHRANNNMQVISALLGIQATTGDAKLKQAVADVQDRILSIALVNQKLYESNDLSKINLRSYIEDLARALLSSLERKATIALVSDMEDVFVLIDSAIPCGLIVNELISNVYKHAYPDDVEGTMDVLLRKSHSGIVTLRIADHGVGVPPDFESRRQEKLGIKYILGICVNQLHGEVHFDEGGGLACVITFSDHLWERRI